MTASMKKSGEMGGNDIRSDATNTSGRPDEVESDNPQVAPSESVEQKHSGPAERHSQQTHRRAAERAAALGLNSEREQHDYDRALVLAELKKVADRKAGHQQVVQSQRNAPPKETA